MLNRLIFGALALSCGIAHAVAATTTVTSTADDGGSGTLRYALDHASAGDTIRFALPPKSTIQLNGASLHVPQSVSIAGPGSATLVVKQHDQGANGVNRVFDVPANTDLSLSGLTLTSDFVQPPGTAIIPITLGIGMQSGGKLTLSDTVFYGLYEAIDVGVVDVVIDRSVFDNMADGGDGSGAAIAVVAGSFAMSNSTIVAGRFSGVDASPALALGYVSSTPHPTMPVSIVNSTIGGRFGADVQLIGNVDAVFVNDTFDPAKYFSLMVTPVIYTASVMVKNSIVSSPCEFDAGVTVSSGGHNIDVANKCGFNGPGELRGVDPKFFGALGDNGGGLPTLAVSSDSPAVDAIPVANCTDAANRPLGSDERGSPRPRGAGCDIGAYELQPPSCSLTVDRSSPTVGSTITLTASCDASTATYDWGSTCPTGASNTCQVSRATPGTFSYTVQGINVAGTGISAAIDVDWLPLSPTCKLTVDNAQPRLGDTITLTATCDNNPTAYDWSACGSTSSNTCQVTLTGSAPIQVQYTVQASNAGGSGNTAAVTVDWLPAPPTCTVAVDNPQPILGSTLTLTATCTNSPTRYTWSNCTSTSNTCRATLKGSIATRATYAVAGTNAGGTGPAATIDVGWLPPVPVCVVAADNTHPALGSTVTLTATCSNNPTRYDWSACGSTSSNTCQVTFAGSTPLRVTYSVQGINVSGSGRPVTVDLDWVQPVPACTLAADDPHPLFGSTITLTATCTNNPTRYDWSACGVTRSNTCQVTLAGTTPTERIYTVQATNAGGTGGASVVVSWRPGAPVVLQSVPTLGEWARWLMIALLALCGLAARRASAHR